MDEVVNRVDIIEMHQPKRSELNRMERWNELIAGFVLGNLTPEEEQSIAEILAENPQLASNITRLRNTATVRSLRQTAWSTARSQDGSEGWADTALGLPAQSIVLDEVATRGVVTDAIMPGQNQGKSDQGKPDQGKPDQAACDFNDHFLSPILDGTEAAPFAIKPSRLGDRTPRASISQVRDRIALEKAKHLPTLRFERFSIIEALIVPVLNPLWWTVFIAAVALGIDNVRVRRSLSITLEEMSQFESMPQPSTLEQPDIFY
ncbi:MAG: hypothetical protein WA947_17275 [Phormidesmis sp.]